MESLNEKIKRLRKETGISQTEMAKSAGINQASFSNIEKGETKSISIEVGKGIAKALGISFTELFEIEGDSQKDDGLNGQIEELRTKIIEKDILIKSLISNNHILKSYLISSIWISNKDRISHLEEQIKNCAEEKETQELTEVLKIYQDNNNRQFKYFISIGVLEQIDIDNFLEGLKDHYETLIRANNS